MYSTADCVLCEFDAHHAHPIHFEGNNMDKSRRLVLTLSSVAVVLSACGGGSDDPPAPAPAPATPPAPPPPPAAQSCGATSMSNPHGHVLTIPTADLDLTTNKTYPIQGQSSHNHDVTLTPAHFAQIKAGTAVTVESTFDSSHTHVVTINCV